MKPKNIMLILVVLIAAVLLSGCGGDAFAASSWPSILVDEEISYVSYNQYVYALNVQDGQLRWRYPENGEAAKTFYAEPTLTEDGQLIVGSYNGSLYSLNPQTGTENWTFDQAGGRFIGAPLAQGSRIYAPSADHRLYALDLNGKEVWRFEGSQGPLWAQPLLDEERQQLYLPSMDHNLYAINPETGQLVWQANLNGSLVGTPVLEDGVLYTGALQAPWWLSMRTMVRSFGQRLFLTGFGPAQLCRKAVYILEIWGASSMRWMQNLEGLYGKHRQTVR
jgi:hypothetical protein